MEKNDAMIAEQRQSDIRAVPDLEVAEKPVRRRND
jgi:hypothetical protein